MGRGSDWLSQISTTVRRLARHPGFSLAAALTLALGVGATTAVFTVLNAVVLNPLPYPNSDRLVRIQSAVPKTGPEASWGLAKAQYSYLRQETRTLEDLGIYLITRGTLAATASGGQDAEQIYVAQASASVGAVLGVKMQLGRPLLAVDNLSAAPTLAWLSEAFWRRRFGGDRSVLGKTLLLDGQVLRIAGVLAPRTELPEEAQLRSVRVDIWTPLWIDPAQPPSASHRFRGVGRLKVGVSQAAAQAELDRLTQRLPEVIPAVYTHDLLQQTGFATQIVPLRRDVVGTSSRVLWLLFAAVALVLVIALANVANLFLARSEGLRHDTALCIALGASRARLGVASIIEALTIAALGGAIGLLLANWAIEPLIRYSPADIPRLTEVRLDGTGIAFGMVVALFCGAALGSVPLLRRSVSTSILSLEGWTSTSSQRRNAARKVLIVAQVSVSLILASGAALLLQSFVKLTTVRSGLDPQGVLTFRLVLPAGRYLSDEATAAYYRELQSRIEPLAGVTSVGFASALPLTGFDGCTSYYPTDHPPSRGEQGPCVPVFQVTEGYFKSMGIPVRGRLAGWDEGIAASELSLPSRALARKFWGGIDGTDRSVQGPQAEGTTLRVIGLAGDVRADGLDKPPAEALYLPLFAHPPKDVAVVVKSSATQPEALLPILRDTVRRLDEQVPLTEVRLLEGILADSRARVLFSSLLLAVASAVAFLLSAIGIYGTLTYLTTQRRSEIGIRMALGARREQVRRSVVRQSVRLASAGICVGLVVALSLNRLLASLLYQISPTDPLTLAGVSLVVLALAIASSWIPAWRAAQIPPLEVLRRG